MKFVKAPLAALAGTAALQANAGQFTDLWDNPQESGWGANVVQQLETAFVTLFVYGPDGKPMWYVASDARIVAYDDALPIFSGDFEVTANGFSGYLRTFSPTVNQYGRFGGVQSWAGYGLSLRSPNVAKRGRAA
jgi:hypothetical protein